MKSCNLILVVFLSLSSFCFASSKSTANYIQSSIDNLDGTVAKADVTYLVKINLDLPNSDVVLFTAHTIDDRNLTYGGNILVIADKSNADELIRKYGTSIDQSRSRAPFKPLKGTVGRIKSAGLEDLIFINISSNKNPEKLPIKRVSVDAVVDKEKTSQ